MMPTSDLPTRQHIDLAPQLMTSINAYSLVVCREGLCAAYDTAKISKMLMAIQALAAGQ